jgi:hypothetical protein
MTSDSDGVRLHFQDSILDCPSRGTSMNLPVAALRRLDAMAGLARFVRPTRNEMLAALIATAEMDPEWLEEQVNAYRRMTIGDVLPARDRAADHDDVVVPIRKPGRPGADRR